MGVGGGHRPGLSGTLGHSSLPFLLPAASSDSTCPKGRHHQLVGRATGDIDGMAQLVSVDDERAQVPQEFSDGSFPAPSSPSQANHIWTQWQSWVLLRERGKPWQQTENWALLEKEPDTPAWRWP